MKCAICGLPLSPTRTTCPGCGTPIGGKRAPQASNSSPNLWAPNQHAFLDQENRSGISNIEVGVEMRPPQQQWTPSPSWETPITPFGQQGGNFAQPAPAPQAQQPLPAHVPMMLSAEPVLPAQEALPFPQNPYTARKNGGKQNIPLGLSVAALCVITGGLILIFVYFMSIGLSTSQPNNTLQVTTGTHSTAPTALPTSVPTATPVVSPTPTYPGQQYVDNIQMASAIDTVSLAPITTTTTFKMNQKIYVTFNVHPGSHNGAICLAWYLNNKSLFSYHRAIAAGSISAFSFATYQATGAGSVEIYWGNIDSCSDPNKLLAQRANFTVTG